MARIIIIILIVAVIALFIYFLVKGGFGLFGGTTSTLNIDITKIIPSTWVPGPAGLQPINIDGDPDVENILFFTFDDNANLWGGVIYDPQSTPLGDPNVSVPQQSPTYLVPYRLQPDYAPNKLSDYLGNSTVDWDAIYLHPVGKADDEDAAVGDRLLVRGKTGSFITRFSAFWWLDKPRGYGGATASTAGSFSMTHDTPNDWGAWGSGANITEVWAWEPQINRSAVCRRTPWNLLGGDQPIPPGPFVKNEAAADIYFCSGRVPPDPAYPEAQVLGWLFEPNPSRVSQAAQGSIQEYKNVRALRITAPADLSTQVDGRVVATGDVDFIASNGANRMKWGAELVPPATIQDTVHWKIIQLAPR